MNPFGAEFNKVSETLKLNDDYVVVEDGNKFPYQYVNLNNTKYCPREGIVEIRPLRGNFTEKNTPKHPQEIYFKRYKDKKTGLLWGIPMGVNDKNKSIEHRAISVEGAMMFDRSVKEEAMLCALILNSPFIEGSPNQNGKPTHKVYDKQIIASKNIDKRTLTKKAWAVIEKISGSNPKALEETALIIGVNTAANKDRNMLLDEVYRIADLDPAKFLSIVESPEREYLTIFHKAMDKALIKLDFASGSYMFGGIFLGHNVEQAVSKLAKDPSMATSISIQCDEIDRSSASSMGFAKHDSSAADEIAKLRAELEALKKSKGGETEEKVEFKAPFGESEDSKEDDLTELRAKAKSLNIKGYGVMKADALLRKIEEAENA
jgi:hypothetical protein